MIMEGSGNLRNNLAQFMTLMRASCISKIKHYQLRALANKKMFTLGHFVDTFLELFRMFAVVFKQFQNVSRGF